MTGTEGPNPVTLPLSCVTLSGHPRNGKCAMELVGRKSRCKTTHVCPTAMKQQTNFSSVNSFSLFFSFDYTSNGAWPTADCR